MIQQESPCALFYLKDNNFIIIGIIVTIYILIFVIIIERRKSIYKNFKKVLQSGCFMYIHVTYVRTCQL